jgi:chaperonin GroES
MEPQRDLILIKADKPKETTSSGLYIQEDWKSLPPTGVVLAVGPLVKEVKVGDRVLFDRYGSVIVNKEDRMCKESHIMAKLDGQAE